MNTNDLTNLILKTVRSSRKNEASKVLARTIKGESDSKSAPVFKCIYGTLENGEEVYQIKDWKLGDPIRYVVDGINGIVYMETYMLYTSEQVSKSMTSSAFKNGELIGHGDMEYDTSSNLADNFSGFLDIDTNNYPYTNMTFAEFASLIAEGVYDYINVTYDGVTYRYDSSNTEYLCVERPQEPEDPSN